MGVMSNVAPNSNLLNLLSIQNKMEQTVFDYVDTTTNMQKAFTTLDELLHQMVNNFNATVESMEGQLPQSSTYWVLFMDIAARLVYFNGLTSAELINQNDSDAKEHTLNLYKLSAKCMPNPNEENSEQFIEEVIVGIQQLEGVNDESTLLTSSSMNECLEAFYQLSKTY